MDQFDNFALHQQKTSNIEYSELLRQEFSILMSTPPLISIALCTYNGAVFLPVQMDSLLAQDWESLEIVVVDDGSIDGTREILLDYASRDPRISLHFNEHNLGFLLNFQKAFSLTRGEFIAPCDQDDWWHPDKLRGLHAAIGNRALAYCDSLLVDSAGGSMGRRVSDVILMYQGTDPAAFVFGNCVSWPRLASPSDPGGASDALPGGLFPRLVACLRSCLDGGSDLRAGNMGALPATCGGSNRPLWPGQTGEEESPTVAGTESPASLDRSISPVFKPPSTLFQGPAGAWDQWTRSWVCPGLVFLLLERRESLFSNNHRAYQRRVRWALRFFWGLKLKRLLIPWRYSPGTDDRAT